MVTYKFLQISFERLLRIVGSLSLVYTGLESLGHVRAVADLRLVGNRHLATLSPLLSISRTLTLDGSLDGNLESTPLSFGTLRVLGSLSVQGHMRLPTIDSLGDLEDDSVSCSKQLEMFREFEQTLEKAPLEDLPLLRAETTETWKRYLIDRKLGGAA